MFDAFHIHPTREVARDVNVTVTEKRAPTDESVRLLREMEQKAEQRIEQTARVEDCDFDIVIHRRHDAMNVEDQFALIYRVNGRKVRVDHHFRPKAAERRDEERERLAQELRQALADSIAVEVLSRAKLPMDKLGNWL